MKTEVIRYKLTHAMLYAYVSDSFAFSIIKNDFEFWLLRNNKLKWTITKSEGIIHRIEEVEGLMSFKEYWEQELSYILNDLTEFIFAQTSNFYLKQFNKLKTTKQ